MMGDLRKFYFWEIGNIDDIPNINEFYNVMNELKTYFIVSDNGTVSGHILLRLWFRELLLLCHGMR